MARLPSRTDKKARSEKPAKAGKAGKSGKSVKSAVNATVKATVKATSKVQAGRKKPAESRPHVDWGMVTPVSPMAPKEFPDMPRVEGVEVVTTKTGEKYKGRSDLTIFRLAPETSVAGVFTKSATAAAVVDWCRSNLGKPGASIARLLVVNAGNANAFTGKDGRDAVRSVGAAAAEAYGFKQKEVFMASTGVIGQPLSYEKILPAFELTPRPITTKGWERAARAISTTDTFPKAAWREADIDGTKVTIAGIAKGSGMIAPDMATMLSFIFTDAKLPPEILATLLQFSVRDTFNSATVDGDTSTNDTVLLFATGQVEGQPEITRPADRRLRDFRDKLYDVMKDLAKQIVMDGEGAQKFVTVRVKGAATPGSARKIAQSIANSPLVKTAIAGEDANWGRIVMAVGKAGEPADRDRLGISFGPHLVAHKGQQHPDYDESIMSAYMKGNEIEITVDIGLGKGQARVWTCDLTHGYISINADYRS